MMSWEMSDVSIWASVVVRLRRHRSYLLIWQVRYGNGPNAR